MLKKSKKPEEAKKKDPTYYRVLLLSGRENILSYEDVLKSPYFRVYPHEVETKEIDLKVATDSPIVSVLEALAAKEKEIERLKAMILEFKVAQEKILGEK